MSLLTSLMWLRSISISLDEYGSKIRKVSRCRPALSNETTLATRKEFILTKVVQVQSITDIALQLDQCSSLECLCYPTLQFILSERNLLFCTFVFQ